MRRLSASLLYALICTSMIGHPATAQELRSAQIIEQARRAKPDIDAGQKAYEQQCITCHGLHAYGSATGVIPSLAGQLPIYIIKQLVDLAEGERESADMHRIAARKSLGTPQAISDVAGYLGGLAPNPRPETGDGSHLDLGKRHYQGLCAFCHGADGGGNEAHATPALRRQHYSYLIMQMREISLGHRYAVNPEILDTLQGLSFEQVTAIADYISRLPAAENTLASERAPAEPVQR